MQEQAVYGYEFEGIRYDAGTTMGWLKASVELALQRPELAPEFRTLPRRAWSCRRVGPTERPDRPADLSGCGWDSGEAACGSGCRRSRGSPRAD